MNRFEIEAYHERMRCKDPTKPDIDEDYTPKVPVPKPSYGTLMLRSDDLAVEVERDGELSHDRMFSRATQMLQKPIPVHDPIRPMNVRSYLKNRWRLSSNK